jgi:hypothetical protein
VRDYAAPAISRPDRTVERLPVRWKARRPHGSGWEA